MQADLGVPWPVAYPHLPGTRSSPSLLLRRRTFGHRCVPLALAALDADQSISCLTSAASPRPWLRTRTREWRCRSERAARLDRGRRKRARGRRPALRTSRSGSGCRTPGGPSTSSSPT